MKNYQFILLFQFLFFGIIYTQQNATTDDGRKVILKNNGTWEYLKEDTNKTIKSSFFDFRKSKWGMSKKEIKKTEIGKIKREEDKVIVFDGTVSNIDALIAYIFVEDKLVRAKYIFTPKHSNKNDFLVDYRTVKDALTEKYGTPQSDDTYWRNDLYKDNYSEWGFAVSLGHLTYSCDWETETSKILLMLSGENYTVDLVTEYSSKELKYLEENEKKKRKLNEY